VLEVTEVLMGKRIDWSTSLKLRGLGVVLILAPRSFQESIVMGMVEGSLENRELAERAVAATKGTPA
jgi:hypothetical protein